MISLRYTLISFALQNYKLILKCNNLARENIPCKVNLYSSPGLLKDPLESILSTYALSPKTEPA